MCLFEIISKLCPVEVSTKKFISKSNRGKNSKSILVWALEGFNVIFFNQLYLSLAGVSIFFEW